MWAAVRIVTNTECHEGPLVDFKSECEHFKHISMTGEPNMQLCNIFFLDIKLLPSSQPW